MPGGETVPVRSAQVLKGHDMTVLDQPVRNSVEFELVENWEKRPKGYEFRDASGVAVDSRDRLYVLTRLQARVLVYEPDGSFVRSFAEGLVTDRSHAITVGPDDMVYIADDGDHTVRKFTPEGKLLLTLGTSGVGSDVKIDRSLPTLYDRLGSITRSGPPFNRPTGVALGPDGDIYVSDGYGNARVHQFTGDGELVRSWGEPGSGPGEFRLPHAIWIDNGRIYLADRENDRIQIFSMTGDFIDQWTHVQRPTDICIDASGNVFVSELAWLQGQRSFLNGVADRTKHGRVSVFDTQGNLLLRLGGADSFAPGNFWAPHALCFDSRGDLYVAEVNFSFSGYGEAGKIPADCHLLQKFSRKH